MQILIDTNIYLSYLRPNADFEQLEKLKDLVKKKKITLLLPKQIQDEYERNVGWCIEIAKTAIRPVIGLEELKRIAGETVKLQKQSITKTELDKLNKDFTTAIKKAEDDVAKYPSEKKKMIANIEKTEKIIAEIFSLTTKIQEKKTHIQNAHTRHIKGNPPRKREKQKAEEELVDDQSFGDAIVWETLLDVATEDDLKIVSSDLDFAEPEEDGYVLNRVLKREWGEKTKKKIGLIATLPKLLDGIEGKKAPKTTTKEVVTETSDKSSFQLSDSPLFGGFSALANTNWSPVRSFHLPQIGNESNIFSPTIDNNHISWIIPNSHLPLIGMGPTYCPYCGSPLTNQETIGLIYQTFNSCAKCGRSFSVN
jgi:hypothetical protein